VPRSIISTQRVGEDDKTDNDLNPSIEQPLVAPRVTASGSYSNGADLNLHRFN